MTTPLAPDVFTSALAEAKRLHLAGEFARARQLYENILSHNPDEPGPQVLLAELDLRDGRVRTACGRLQQVVARHPESREVRAALANVLEELGDISATTTFYREETERDPSKENWLKLAAAQRIAGHTEDAVAAFRHVIKTWPDIIAGYSGLVAIDPALLAPEDLGRLRAITTDERVSPDERMFGYFALGHVYESADRYDAAFEAYAEGNRLKRDNPNPYPDPPEWKNLLANSPPLFTSVEQAERMHDNFVRETINMFTPAYLAKFAGGGDPSNRPIFIVGMPRSGSTLLEQILSSHPDVQGLGETQALSR